MPFISSFPKAGSTGIRLSGITVTTPPTKTSYYAGDTFDTSGMVVTVIYTNGATAPATGYTVSPSVLTINTSFVTITYGKENAVLYAIQDITVSKFPVTIPTLEATSFTYDGSLKSPINNNYDSSKMSVSGDSATDAGNYTVTFSLLDSNSCVWSDGTITNKSFAWSIAKASGSLNLSSSSVTLNSSNLTKTVTIYRYGDGAITATSNNTSVATVSVSDNILTISSVNNTNGDAIITVSVAEGTNYTSPSNVTCSVTASFISATLNNNSWSTIKSVSSTGFSYWAVGDCKSVTLNGTVGAYTFSSETYYCYILGFNHNSTYEGNGIHFAFGKTALTNGVNICFVDSLYGSFNTSTRFYINSSNINIGGWNNSYMRQTLCNSQFKLVLPSGLQSVLKNQTKYTDNAGGTANVPSQVTSTLDYIFLLSEYEVFGTRNSANSAEQNYQKQYQYYVNGNSKVKYKHNATGITATWWLRSCCCFDFGNFCSINIDGVLVVGAASTSFGFSPCFVV